MLRKLVIFCMLTIICSNAIYADGPVVKTYADIFSEISQLNRNEVAIIGTVFGLCTLGFGALTKYCWKKVKSSTSRVKKNK